MKIKLRNDKNRFPVFQFSFSMRITRSQIASTCRDATLNYKSSILFKSHQIEKKKRSRDDRMCFGRRLHSRYQHIEIALCVRAYIRVSARILVRVCEHARTKIKRIFSSEIAIVALQPHHKMYICSNTIALTTRLRLSTKNEKNFKSQKTTKNIRKRDKDRKREEWLATNVISERNTLIKVMKKERMRWAEQMKNVKRKREEKRVKQKQNRNEK